MTIGSKLLELRKQRGISQQELASYLNISRQTVSKFEHDLSLPDMDMMIKICEYYQITVNEFLGIEEMHNDSITEIYEQIQIVSSNIQRNNKRMKILNTLLIIISIASLCLSLIVVNRVHEYDQILKRNDNSNEIDRCYVNIVNNDNNVFIDANDVTFMDTEKYDLTNMKMLVHFQFGLKNYTKNTKVKLHFKPWASEENFEYDLEKVNDYTFKFNKEIPLLNYGKVYLIIDDGKGNMINENISENGNCDYLSYILKKYIYLYIPLDSNHKLKLNTIVYDPGANIQFENIEGDLNMSGSLIIKIYKNDKTTCIKNTAIALNKKTILTLDDNITMNDETFISIVTKLSEYGTYGIYDYRGSNNEIMSSFTVENNNEQYQIYPR